MGTDDGLEVCCLVASTSERATFLDTTLSDFARQTHRQRKMIVAVPEDETAYAQQIEALAKARGLEGVSVIVHPKSLSLGAKRNLMATYSASPLIAQWDDDDRYHPRRLEEQVQMLVAEGLDAVYLGAHLHYWMAKRELRLLRWGATPAKCHPGTVLYRSDIGTAYGDTNRDEDLAFCLGLRERAKVGILTDKPWLYVYQVHASNTCGIKHQEMLTRTLAVSSGLLRRQESVLRAELAFLELGREPVMFAGSNSLAFKLGDS